MVEDSRNDDYTLIFIKYFFLKVAIKCNIINKKYFTLIFVCRLKYFLSYVKKKYPR